MPNQTYERPDVYFNEVLSDPTPDSGVSLSNGVFVGPHPRGPLGITRVTSYRAFVALYGDFSPGVQATDLQIAVWLFFNTGGHEAYVLRVPDGHEVAASATLMDREPTVVANPNSTPPVVGSAPRSTLLATAVNPGTWANVLSVGITDASDPERFNLFVFSGGQQIEKWSDLSMDPTDSRYAVSMLNSVKRGSRYITLTDSDVPNTVTLANKRPAQTGTGSGNSFVLVPAALTSGGDATGVPSSGAYDTAFAAVDAVAIPVNLNLPGVVDEGLINAALAYCETRGNAFLVIDGTTGADADVASQISQVGLYSASSYGSAPYFPRVVISDPSGASPGATRVVATGGAVMGYYAVNDAVNGVQKTPAGLAARIPNAIGLEVALSDDDLAQMNVNQVNAIRSMPGSGIVIMGGRTLSTSGKSDKYISVRRSLIYIKSMLRQLTGFGLFADNDYLLWQQLYNVCEAFMLSFWQANGLSGSTAADAFYVVCDATNNDENAVEQGIVNVEIGAALQRPAEFIVITLSQFQGSAITVVAEAA